MRTIPAGYQGLHRFRPPYRALAPADPNSHPGPCGPGEAAVWFMHPGGGVSDEMRWCAVRPLSLPLFVVLPAPEQVLDMRESLRTIPALRPRGVLPGYGGGTLAALRTLLAAPPPALPRAVADLLEAMDVIGDGATRQRIQTIFAAAPNTQSIKGLSRALCQSRRTVGRFFQERGLPVPSHWLQFARVLHVAIQLQNTSLNIGRVSVRYGYPDGFTMSNTMKRLTGYRPSFVREHLGWEWLVEAWWRTEKG